MRAEAQSTLRGTEQGMVSPWPSAPSSPSPTVHTSPENVTMAAWRLPNDRLRTDREPRALQEALAMRRWGSSSSAGLLRDWPASAPQVNPRCVSMAAAEGGGCSEAGGKGRGRSGRGGIPMNRSRHEPAAHAGISSHKVSSCVHAGQTCVQRRRQ